MFNLAVTLKRHTIGVRKTHPLIAVSLLRICLFGAIPAGYADTTNITGSSPGDYSTVTQQAAQAELAQLQALLNSGQITPAQFADSVSRLGITSKSNLSADTVQSTTIDPGGIAIPLGSTPGGMVPLVPGAGSAQTAQICVNSNGYNAYYMSRPNDQSFGWNGPQCFTVTTAGTYCIGAPGGNVTSITTAFPKSDAVGVLADSNCISLNTPGETVTFNLSFTSPKPAPAPVPINNVLNNLYYYDGYRAIPLKDELQNVYYDDGSAKGVSIMSYLDKISIHTDPGGHYPMPPPLEMLFVKINGVDKPLAAYLPKLNYVDSSGKKWPIAPNLMNIVAIQSASSPSHG